MMRAKLSTCAVLLAIATPLFADSALPLAGMSMQAVEGQFGKPASKAGPVGHPPITRWDYGDYVVVFERSTVVNSVRVVRAAGSTPASKAVAPTPAAAPVVSPAPAAAPSPAVPETSPAPAKPKSSGTRATVTVTVKPVDAKPAEAAAPAEPAAVPAAPPAPAGTSGDATVQDALQKAAAEKAAEGAPAAAAPADATAPAPANDGYTFDPETGRIIIK